MQVSQKRERVICEGSYIEGKGAVTAQKVGSRPVDYNSVARAAL